MRKQRSTFPTKTNQQRFVTRPVPPRTVTNSKGGWPRHGRYGAR
ncbi:hypothetical protein AB0L97_10830 [Nocardia sp. NPDC051911]